ncbi:MAG: helix-turn-helix transcriptional regulator [Cyanobacteriota bacterium]
MSVGTTTDSSIRLIRFLEENRLHKKDFAEMIGVTLSYVYSLIDSKVSFSKRITTLERIAVVMGISPNDFPEYKCPEEPKLIDPGVQYLKIQQKKLGLTNVQLLKRFPRSRRVEIVDLWRGAEPLPLDWNYLASILSVLNVSVKDFYPYWQTRMQQYLIAGGIDPISNAGFMNNLFNSCREYLKI